MHEENQMWLNKATHKENQQLLNKETFQQQELHNDDWKRRLAMT
jgi:hypothetical protein